MAISKARASALSIAGGSNRKAGTTASDKNKAGVMADPQTVARAALTHFESL